MEMEVTDYLDMKRQSLFVSSLIKNSIIVVAIICIVVTFNVKIASTLHKQEIENCKSVIEVGLNRCTVQLNSLTTTLSRSFQTTTLSRLSILTNTPQAKDYLLMKEGIDYLQTVSGSNDVVADMVIQFEGSNIVITTKNSFLSVEDFLKYYQLDGFDKTVFSNPIFRGSSQAVKSNFISSPSIGREETAFCYIVPITASSGSLNNGTAYIFLRKQPVLDSLLLNSMSAYGNIVLMDKNKDVIMQYSASPIATLDKTNRNISLELANTANTLFCSAVIDKEYFDDILSSHYRQSGIFVVIAIITGVAVALLVSFRETRPINKLIAELKQLGIIPGQSKNAYEMVLNSAMQMEVNKGIIEKQVKLYRHTISSSVLSQFLYYGKSFTDYDLENFYTYFPNFPEKYVLCYWNVEYGESLDHSSLAILDTLMSETIRAELPSGTIVHSIDGSSFVIICPFTDTEQLTLDRLGAALSKANEQLSFHINTSVSRVYDNALCLTVAFDECKKNLFSDWAKNSGSGNDEFFTGFSCKIHMNDVYELYLNLLNGNSEESERLMRFIFCHLESLHIESEQRYYAIRLAIDLAARDAEMSEQIPKLSKYNKISSPNEALEKLLAVGDALCSTITNKHKLTLTEKGIQFLQYIDENYSDDMLCPASVADHFNLSEKYLYAVFKESTGHSPASYILTKRMKIAADMLKTTDMIVQEISVAVGFNNFSTFHKAFKREFSTTPGQYRMRNKI